MRSPVPRDESERERIGREQADRLRAATRALGLGLGLTDVLATILAELRRLVPCDSASVQELIGHRLEIIGVHGFPNPEEVLGTVFDTSESGNPNRVVVQKRATFVVDDAPARYPFFAYGDPHAAEIRSWMGVPLLFGDRLFGMVALDKKEPDFFTEEHVALTESFAPTLALAIEHARLHATA
jgi:GAF domain-containing protein